MSESKKKIKF